MKNEKIKTVAIVTAVILIFALILGMILSLTRSSESPASTLYVERDGEKIQTGSETEIEIGETVRFDVGYDLSFISGESGYHVKITPRITEETDFTYTVDGTEKKFSEIPALTNAFNVVVEEDGFTLNAEGDMKAILSKLHQTDSVSGVPSIMNIGVAYFTMTVLSADQTESVEIYLKLTGEEKPNGDLSVTDIKLNYEEIVF